MIFKTNKYLIVVFFFIVFNSSCDQKHNRNKETNYDYTGSFAFEPTHTRYNKLNINLGDDYFSYDRINFTEGKTSLKISNKKLKMPFNTSIFNYFSLPQNAKEVIFKIDGKTENIKMAMLKAIYYDADENHLGSDSVSITSNGKWGTFDMKIECSEIRNIYFEITIESNTDSLDVKKANIDNLQIFCNFSKKDARPEANENSVLISEIVKNPTSSNTLNNIHDLKTHRIISIGESVHGSLEFQKATYEIIKYQIQQNNCSLILFEMPYNLGFAVNNYISGICNNEIEKNIAQVTLETTELKLFIDWLKAYNSLHKEKVVFVGTDMIFGFAKDDYFPEYLEYLKKIDPSINGIISLIAEKKYQEAQKMLSENSSLNGEEKTLISLGLQGLITGENKLFQYNEMRDQFMFYISKIAIDGLLRDSATAVLYSHLIHTNKLNNCKSRLYFPNLGSLLAQEFGDNYFAIAFLTGKGRIANQTFFSGKGKLVAPIEGSIEKLCYDNFEDDFYFKIDDKIPSYTGRIMGFNYKTDQFYPNSAHNRYDALIFFRKSNAYKISALN